MQHRRREGWCLQGWCCDLSHLAHCVGTAIKFIETMIEFFLSLLDIGNEFLQNIICHGGKGGIVKEKEFRQF
jgi:hypothetical protein